ncbi:hypothetical protein [Lysinibacillus xylanilyticus]|uniref:hypothetical protein n=1 Tax=Lysinibacillus xylanilyticus TaxID=582475 RepID=UPI003CFF133C
MRKRSDNAAAATCFCLCESEATATQHEVGHSVVATGRGVLRLSSSISAMFSVTKVKRQLQMSLLK